MLCIKNTCLTRQILFFRTNECMRVEFVALGFPVAMDQAVVRLTGLLIPCQISFLSLEVN
jgi:hypothetical protein